MGKKFFIIFLTFLPSLLWAQVPTFTPTSTPSPTQSITSQQLAEAFYIASNPVNPNTIDTSYANLMAKLQVECMSANKEFPDNNVVSTPTNNSRINCITEKIKSFSPSTPPVAPMTVEIWKTNFLKSFTTKFLKSGDTFYQECTDHSECQPSITKTSCLPLYEVDQFGKTETADQEFNVALLGNLYEKGIIGKKPANGPASEFIHCPSLLMTNSNPASCAAERKGCRKASAGEINKVGTVEGCESGLEIDPNNFGPAGEKLCRLKTNFIVDKLPEMLNEINISTDGKLSEQFTTAYSQLAQRIDAAEIVFQYAKDKNLHDDACSDEIGGSFANMPYEIRRFVTKPHLDRKKNAIQKFNLKLNSILKDFELLKKDNPDLATIVNFSASNSNISLRELREKNAGGAQYLKVMKNYLTAQAELYTELKDIYKDYKSQTDIMVNQFSKIDADTDNFQFFNLSNFGKKNFRNWKYKFRTRNKAFSGGKNTTEMIDIMAQNNEIELDTLARFQITKPLSNRSGYIDPIIPQNYSTFIHWKPRFLAWDGMSKKCVSRDRDEDVDDRWKLRDMYKAWEQNANAFYEERISNTSYSDDVISSELSLKAGCFEKGKNHPAISSSNLIKCDDKDRIVKEVAKIANSIQFAYNYNHDSINYKFYKFGKNQNFKPDDRYPLISKSIEPDIIYTADNNPRFLALIELDRNVKIMANIVTKLQGFYEKSIAQIDSIINGPNPDNNTTTIADTYQGGSGGSLITGGSNLGNSTITNPNDPGLGNGNNTTSGTTSAGNTAGINENSASNNGASNRSGGPQTTLGSSGLGSSSSSSGSAMAERGGYDPNNPASSSGSSSSFNNGTNRMVAVKSMGSGTTIKKANGNDLGIGGFGGIFGNEAPAISPQSGLAPNDENHMLQNASNNNSNKPDEDRSLFEDITQCYYRQYKTIFGKQKSEQRPITTTIPDNQRYRAR